MDSAIDKSARSCFVGNIPYEATEEKLKEIFSSVGPVISFKLVYDRENGKPRGYGFCEFMDPETAMSAMRNLNGYEINGRPLRVDSASTERSEINLPGVGVVGVTPGAGPVPEQSPYGDSVDPDKAPEAISKAVASLPPEQMFELMKQMKECIINNPQEARDMLLKNPQLAYALLQALVVMRIVEPEMALNMLHKQAPKNLPIGAAQPQPSMAPVMGDRFRGDHPPGPFPPQSDMDRRDPRMDDRFSRDPRGDRFDRDSRDRDPRAHRDPRADRDPRSDTVHRDPRGGGSRRQDYPPPGVPPQLAAADPDKAELIRQVLQLSDVQIAALPPEQQASILDLKRQLGNVPK